MIGGIVSFWFAIHSKSISIRKTLVAPLFISTIFYSLLGGKLFLIFEPEFTFYGITAFFTSSGYVFYGAVIFNLAGWFVFAKVNRISYATLLDDASYCGAILLFFGKLGCFFAGCCYGKNCSLPIAITYSHPDSAAVPLHTGLYPVQLFDSAVAIIILLWLHATVNRYPGYKFLMVLLMYTTLRFVSEFFRGDIQRGFIIEGYLSNAQFVSMIIISICLTALSIMKKRLQHRNSA
jgi:phosphatidylglycerol:prolipoprotein diacylglycerol transferase